MTELVKIIQTKRKHLTHLSQNQGMVVRCRYRDAMVTGQRLYSFRL